MKILESDKKLGNVIPNIATLLNKNVEKFGEKIVFSHKINEKYTGITWNEFYSAILNISYNLKYYGFEKGDKIVLFSPNRLEMLMLELAVMASGGIAVPIFAYFKKETASLLIKQCDAKFLAVAGEYQLNNIDEKLDLKHIFVFDDIRFNNSIKNIHPFKCLTTSNNKNTYNVLNTDANPEDVCLNMFTSGTMGVPKCVQLTHKNILSQQAALDLIWDINEEDRFLSYLPWHHSFGGIFEIFNVLYRGATYYLESSYGKDPKEIMKNWQLVKPTVFFSVPKIYKALIEQITEDKSLESIFFHPKLKFVFTAAAPLPEKILNEFKKRNIPVIEGWGLTETSPCCTITDPAQKVDTRTPGIVGNPLPGIKIRIAKDGEIQVYGPNVMKGYYKSDIANKKVFTKDNWFKTGDIGEITSKGLKLITRKDRIFKLSNGEKVIPSDLEKIIEKKCHYIAYAVVTGNGEEYPVALLFPNKKMFENPEMGIAPISNCYCPKSLKDLSNCLFNCLKIANNEIKQKFSKIKVAGLIDDELTIENNTLTPSLKIAPTNVINQYMNHIKKLYGKDVPTDKDIYVIVLN